MIPSPLLFDRMVRELIRRRDDEVTELVQAGGRQRARLERRPRRTAVRPLPAGRPLAQGKRRRGAT